jgi:general secretion pathway protein K
MVRDRERGFALVAAVAAVAAFAYISFEVMATDRGVIAGVSARVEQQRLIAAADAGVMMAIHGLAQEDVAQRWSIDGRTRGLVFDGIDLQVTVNDERGKAPLDGLNPAQARALFEGAGAQDDRVDALVNELRDFQSAEDDSDNNAPAAPVDGEPQGLAAAPVRRGGFRTVGDLMTLKDMDSDLYSRIAPAVTVFFEESGPFEPSHADPLAAAAMAAQEAESPEEVAAEREDNNEPPEEAIVDENVIGRTFTITVVARDRNKATAHRSVIMELTGSKAPGYWIRYVE